MSMFVARAACRGHRPSSFNARSWYQRPDLVRRLLAERSVARFIVAPDGYGKTLLALDYAETMLSWDHAFWISGESPCFIRDLDAQVIASSCLEADAEVSLVVIDDLPLLDSRRAKLFSKQIDVLLKQGCEVIVTCVPSHDVMAECLPVRLRLGAQDLLLSDEELDADRLAEEKLRHPSSSIPEAQRIAVFAWGGDEDAQSAFAQGLLGEKLPSDVLFAFASILVLQIASPESLSRIGITDDESIRDLMSDYPHLGFNAETNSYEAARIDAELLASVVKKKLSALVPKSAFGTVEELVMTWADILLENGFAGRACDVMRLLCPRAYRGPWLIENAWDLVRRTCFYPAFRIAKEQKGLNAVMKARMAAFEALCRRILGDEPGALKAAKRCGFDAGAPEDARVCGALVVARLGEGKLLEQARMVLRELAQVKGGLKATPFQSLAQAWCASDEGPGRLAALWCDLQLADASDDVLLIGASWLYSLFGRDQWREEESSLSPEVRLKIEQFVCERLAPADELPLGYFAASAGLSLEEAHERGVPYYGGAPQASRLLALRNVEMNVLSQRGDFEHAMRLMQVKRGDWIATHPDSFLDVRGGRDVVAINRKVPILSLRLFGHLEVALGDVHLEQRCHRRQHVRNLIALLAVNQGREVPRDQLARAMWPASTERVRKKNFYVVWSQLRSVLLLPDGTCPYLIRQQYSCSFEPRYVRSDADRLSEICRELLFGKPDIEHWSDLYEEIDRDFSCELLPSERTNQMVIQARNDFRSRLVDAMVAATYGIVGEGNPQRGIWFARSATVYDETREDAYVALMRAQIAANQRTAAMMTFLKCRKVLDERLGIDPSPEAHALYESLLGSQ